jgi:hypothetical protein
MTGKNEKEKMHRTRCTLMLINQTKTYYRETGEIAKSKVSVNMIY